MAEPVNVACHLSKQTGSLTSIEVLFHWLLHCIWYFVIEACHSIVIVIVIVIVQNRSII